MARVFKARMIYLAACGEIILLEDGSMKRNPHWFEVAKEQWALKYKSTGTPCRCWFCRREEYNRRSYKKDSLRIIRESLE